MKHCSQISYLGLFCSEVLSVNGTHCSQIGHLGLFCSEVLMSLCSSISNNFYTKPSRLSIQVNSFSRIGVKVWNEIPQALRNLSKNAFKRKLKQILFNILVSQDSYIDLSQIINQRKLRESRGYISCIHLLDL